MWGRGDRWTKVRRGLAAALALGAMATFAGCKLLDKLGTHEGDRCSGDVAVCRGPEVALVCHDKKYVETPCRGPEGCKVSGGSLTCDFGKDTEADKCPAAWEDQGQCDRDEAFVVCRGGHYRRFACRGPKGCSTSGTNVVCDMSVVEEGDACSKDEQVSCSKDRKSMLTCKGGKMGASEPCRGKQGCHAADGGKLACDKSIAAPGDTCDKGGACSVDGQAMLDCRDGKQVVSHVCREGACKSEGETVGCANMGVAEVGDPCSGDVGACSGDRKAMLGCRDGHYALDRKCACLVEGDSIKCR